MLDTTSLETLLESGETPTLEFKVAPPRISELAERLCGFANSLGGMLVIGVADKSWEVVGVKNASEAADTVLQAARLCKPTVRLEPAHPQVMELKGKPVLVATVPPNDGTLYQAGGVFWVRRGTHTIPLDLTEIEAFLYMRGTLNWETRPVLRATLQDLDMTLVEAYLNQRPDRSKLSGRLANTGEVLINLGCATATGDGAGQMITRPTNAGMLLFGYAPQQFLMQSEIVCTLYAQGDSLGLRRYADRRVLHGTLTRQIDQAEAFFKQYVPVAARMQGFHRIDEPDYPLEALREAVVNAVVHRDYSLQGEAVRLFYYTGDRVEIHNPGLLLPGVRLEDLQQGQARSRPRNAIIANILRDLPGGYMERVGSGISFMLNQMRLLGRPDPQFKEQGEFVVTFWQTATPATDLAIAGGAGRDALVRAPVPINSEPPSTARPAPIDTLAPAFNQSERQELALRYVHQHGSITNRQYRALSGTSENTALRDLEALVERGALRAIGEKRGRRYVL